MNGQTIEGQFEKMGSRARVSIANKPLETRGWNGRIIRVAEARPLTIDVSRDGKGEFFEISHRWDIAMQVIDVRRSDRHLVLMARGANELKSKYLCGHDERAWFVAAIPESARVSNVQQAKDALKPEAVWESIRAHRLSPREYNLRWTKAFVRQGEWFFIPRPNVDLEDQPILRNEPIRRGRGKPHMCQFLVRFGGEQVYTNARYSNGLTLSEFRKLDVSEQNRRDWRVMVRNAHVYVKGSIRHADHATIWLADWHEVVMNTETQADAMRHMAFLD